MQPKDETQVVPVHGHRYDWQSAAIFVNKVTMLPEKICLSARQTYMCYAEAPVVKLYNHTNGVTKLAGVHYKVKYYRSPTTPFFHSHHHKLIFADDGDVGTLYPLLDIDQMPEAARQSLNTFDWGSGVICPVAEAVWRDFLEDAWNAPMEKL